MLEKIKDFVIAHREQIIRITFASTFILRGIMQLFPWLFIQGITENFVVYPPPRDLAICALGLAILLIRWKRTFFRTFVVWISATTLWFQIELFAVIMGENQVYLTTPYWIFSFLTSITWAYGTGLIIGARFERMLDSLEKNGYFTRMITMMEKKKKRRRKGRKVYRQRF